MDVAEDLLGPNVKFHHSKLNFKWSGGGEEVRWHQDIQFWPHTNYQVLTLGVYLDDVTDDMSPMAVIPNSHNGPLYDLYDDSGKWAGALKDEDIDALDVASAVYLGGPAGSITAHNCRCVHGSAPNRASKPRPLLLCAYSSSPRHSHHQSHRKGQVFGGHRERRASQMGRVRLKACAIATGLDEDRLQIYF